MSMSTPRHLGRAPTTERVQRLKDQAMKSAPRLCSQRLPGVLTRWHWLRCHLVLLSGDCSSGGTEACGEHQRPHLIADEGGRRVRPRF